MDIDNDRVALEVIGFLNSLNLIRNARSPSRGDEYRHLLKPKFIYIRDLSLSMTRFRLEHFGYVRNTRLSINRINHLLRRNNCYLYYRGTKILLVDNCLSMTLSDFE